MAILPITKAVTLTFTPQQLDTIIAALERLPYMQVAPLMDELVKQIKAQMPEPPPP